MDSSLSPRGHSALPVLFALGVDEFNRRWRQALKKRRATASIHLLKLIWARGLYRFGDLPGLALISVLVTQDFLEAAGEGFADFSQLGAVGPLAFL